MASTIAIIEHGEIRTGIWCEPCALPSAVEFELVMLGESGISTIGTAHLCTECGEMS